MEKKCTKCQEVKDIGQFWKNKRKKDGYAYSCRSCEKPSADLRRLKNKERNSKYAKEYYEKHKTEIFARNKKYWTITEEHKIRHEAGAKVRAAVRRGDIVRQPCEVCGEKKTHGHHDDYSKPLQVRWLCHKHHMEHHHNLLKLKAQD